MKTGTYYREVTVSERLPKESGKYFVIYKDGDEIVKTEAEFSDGYWGWKGHLFNKSVTHWLEKVEFTLPDTGDIEEKYLYFLANEKPTDNYISATDKRIIFNWFKDNGYLRKPITEQELYKKLRSIAWLNNTQCVQLAREILTLLNR